MLLIPPRRSDEAQAEEEEWNELPARTLSAMITAQRMNGFFYF